MYCRKCGRELQEDSRFCPSCGSLVANRTETSQVVRDAEVHADRTPQASGETDELLFESKGVDKGRKSRSLLCGVVLLACGAILIGLSNARHSTSTIEFYAVSGNDRILTDTGQIGGGPMFNSDGRSMLLYIGLFAIFFAIVMVPLSIQSFKKLSVTSVRVFKNHIDGVTTTGNPFLLTFSPGKPLLVEVIGNLMTISQGDQRYVVGVNPESGKTAQECASLIRSLVDPRDA